MSRIAPRTLAAAVAMLFLAPIWALAGEDVQQLKERLEALKERYDKQTLELKALTERLEKLEGQMRGKGVSRSPVGTMAQAAAGQRQTQAPEPAAAPQQEEKVVKEPQRTRSVEAIYQQREAVFERRFTFEPSLTYSRFDRRLINLSGFLALDAIFLGTIDVQQTKSDLFTLDLTGRWGVTDRLQLDLNIPFLYRSSDFFSGGAGGAAGVTSKADVSNGDLGDMSVGMFYQLWRETVNRPDLILSARLKAPTGKKPYGMKVVQPDPTNTNLNVPEDLPTGSGVWAASLGLSFLKTSDPAILFGNVGIIHNFKRSFDDISTQTGIVQPGEVDLRRAFLWGAGIGFAINERMSMSFAFNQLLQQSARQKPAGQPWQSIVGSDANAASFNVGVTYGLGEQTTLIANLGIGLTPDAPDFSLNLRLPYSF